MKQKLKQLRQPIAKATTVAKEATTPKLAAESSRRRESWEFHACLATDVAVVVAVAAAEELIIKIFSIIVIVIFNDLKIAIG